VNYNYNKYPPAGIDLGTSNSVIAVYENKVSFKGARPLDLNCNTPSGPLLPSAVFLEEDNKDHKLIVGPGATGLRISQPEFFATAFKRRIADNSKNIRLGNKYFSAVELSKEVVKKLLAEAISQEPDFAPPGIVVSVPYYFTHIQKKNTELAAEMAIEETFGKNHPDGKPKLLGLIPEPVAAAINYCFNNRETNYNNHNILIYDFGGGTLDITICRLNISPDKLSFDVLATDGCEKFGGEDLDDVLEAYLREIFEEEFDKGKLTNKNARILRQEIRDLAKSAKEQLSYSKKANLIKVLVNGKTIDAEIKRREFEMLLKGENLQQRDFGGELKDIIDRTIKKAKIKPESIQKVLMVGGSSHIPYFKRIIELKCPSAKYISDTESIETSVAKGAAIYASYLLDITSQSNHNAFNRKLTYGKLTFRTSHTLGVQKEGELFEPIISSNTVVPASKSKTFYFSGYKNNRREQVATKKIFVYQGESSLVSNNTKIGEINLPPVYTHNRALKDIPIRITFTADENFVTIKVFIPASDINGNDITLKENLKI